jgi:sugar O-acyltransferase (sialic acid O-acetyltransferase NeuD family)
MTPPLPVIVLGYGGHAAVVIDALHGMGRQLLGVVGPAPSAEARPAHVLGVPVLGDDHTVDEFPAGTVELALGVGGGNEPAQRRALFDTWRARGYAFVSVLHPSAVVSSHAVIGHGVQIMAGAVVQARASLGANVLVNSRASIDHDCVVRDHAHIAPGVTLCGHVWVGEGALIGAGSVVLPARRIGARTLVRAGSIVTRDSPVAS